MKTILLKFAGPLQSWGTSSHFETRHTDFYPSKSAVIGMIAASLGYRRNEDEKIRKLNELDFAVRVDQQGNLLRDWHNAKSDKRKDPYTTNRYYLEDAVFVVAISHQNYAFIQMIEDGLRSPCFQPFMGRRACPLPVDFIVQVTWYMKRQSTDDRISLEIYTDSYLTGKESYQLRQDKVLSFSQKERKFGFRYESRVRVEVLNPLWQEQSSTEHDIFNSIGD